VNQTKPLDQLTELCLFPAIIQIAFGDVNSSRLINHASRDSLTLRMSNVLASHLVFFSRFPNLPTTYRLILYHPIFKMLLKPPVEMHWESLIFILFFFKMQFATALGWQSRDVCVTHVWRGQPYPILS